MLQRGDTYPSQRIVSDTAGAMCRKPAGAMWRRDAARRQGGRCWAEVYCGSAESGNWIHVDPISGTIDR